MNRCFLLLFICFFFVSSIQASIYVDGIIENKRLVPCVFINDVPVIKLFDKGLEGEFKSSFQRAQAIAEILLSLKEKGLMNSPLYVRKNKKVYYATMANTRVFAISPGDIQAANMTGYQLALKWRNDLKSAISLLNDSERSEQDNFKGPRVFPETQIEEAFELSQTQIGFLALVLCIIALTYLLFKQDQRTQHRLRLIEKKLGALTKHNKNQIN